MFTISLCMIVKNESAVLKRALDCVKKFADEIIIVDTGSEDNTKEIAKKFTEKVYDFAWCDDFSKARNFSFSLASCDYQMWLDADDVITDENIQKINALKNNFADVDVFMCKYSTGFDSENQPSITYFRERILKRADNFKWQGFVHEVIAPCGKIEYTDIEIEHHKVVAGDPKRNLKLYQKALKKGVQFSPRELYYYARELFYTGQYRKSAQYLKKFLKIEGTYPPDHFGAHIMLCDCFLAMNEEEKALNILFSYMKYNPPNAEICCKLAYIFDKLKNTECAIFWFKTALISQPQTQGFVKKDCQDFTPLVELSRLLYQKDYAYAKECHKKAKAIHPNHFAVKFNDKFFTV